ncbi:MAG: ABC transporter permease [Mycobacteriales bacterium]
MLLVTLRDLQWRLRRFLIAGIGAATVFALTLVMAGLVASFESEPVRVLDAVGADAWVMPTGVDGVFTTISVLPESTVASVARQPGVTEAWPVVVLHHTVREHGTKDVTVVAYADGGLGTPHLTAGRLPRGPRELVADKTLHAAVGSRVSLAGKDFTVVGRTSGMSMNAGQPLLFTRLHDAQRTFVGGAAVISAVLTKGVPARLPAGLQARSRETTKGDMLRPIHGALQSVKLTLSLLWVVAALVVGSVVYLSALERARDFAVYKATGWSNPALAVGLALQAMLLSTGASLLGVLGAQLLLPAFPLEFGVPPTARLLLPVVGAAVGLLASAAGLRRAVGVQPALAFGGQ